MDGNAIEQMLYERAVNSKLRGPQPEGQHRVTSSVVVMGLLFLANTFMSRSDSATVSHDSAAPTPQNVAPVSINQHANDAAIATIAMSQIGR